MNATERYRIAEIMSEAYRDYENGLVALRKRVVADMKRKLSEAGVLSPLAGRPTPRSAPARRRR